MNLNVVDLLLMGYASVVVFLAGCVIWEDLKRFLGKPLRPRRIEHRNYICCVKSFACSECGRPCKFGDACCSNSHCSVKFKWKPSDEVWLHQRKG